MCWQAAIPLLMSAAGTAVSMDSQRQAQRRRDQELAAGILKSTQANREAGAEIQQETQKIAQSNPDAERAAKRATYIDALHRTSGSRDAAMPGAGAASSRFSEDLGAAQASAAAEGNELADLTAEIEAPQYQRVKEGTGASNLATKLSLISGRAGGQDYLARLHAAMVKPNEGQMAAGQIMSGFGQGLAANGGWGEGGSDNVWMDGTTNTGLTADQRRRKHFGG
jgi:hypothetical protein